MNYNYSYRRGPVIEPAQLIAANDIYHATTSQKYMLGCKLELSDGRIFRYCECSAGVTKALMTTQIAATGNWVDQDQSTGTASVAGDTSIKVYVATAPSANDWNDGWLVILDGTGEGEAYLIKSHDASLLPVIQIADTGGIRTATAASSSTEITVITNPYKGILIHPHTTPTGMPTGVPLCTIATNSFGWLQRRGPCPMFVDTGVSVGLDVGFGTSTAGGAKARATTKPAWGVCTTAVGEADGTATVFLTLE